MYSAIDPSTAWEIAGFASRNNFPDVFKLAIAAFHQADWLETGSQNNLLPLACLRALPIKYAIALVTAMHKHEGDGWRGQEMKWRDISESFKLEDD